MRGPMHWQARPLVTSQEDPRLESISQRGILCVELAHSCSLKFSEIIIFIFLITYLKYLKMYKYLQKM